MKRILKQRNKNKNKFILTLTTVLCIIAMLAAVISGCGSKNEQPSSSAGKEAAGQVSEKVSEEDSKEASEEASEEKETKEQSAEQNTVSDETGQQEEEASELEEEEVKSSEAGKKRILPHEVKSADDKEPKYPSVDEIEGVEGKLEGPSVMFVEKKSIIDSKVKGNKADFPDSQEDVDALLENLASYWKDYNLDTVDYLVRMEKYRYMSQLLGGTNDYFYLGEENEAGEPDGLGIAVYSGNSYYYGHFKNGQKEGDGFWYRIFVMNGIYSKSNNGIVSHSYRGEWASDLPNGEGQEHLDIDTAYLEGRIVTNVIGSFVNGYYNGEELVISIDSSEGSISWKGTAINGTWVPYDKGLSNSGEINKQVPILENTEKSGNYFWMLEKENKGQGITGLIK